MTVQTVTWTLERKLLFASVDAGDIAGSAITGVRRYLSGNGRKKISEENGLCKLKEKKRKCPESHKGAFQENSRISVRLALLQCDIQVTHEVILPFLGRNAFLQQRPFGKPGQKGTRIITVALADAPAGPGRIFVLH